ncbi:MAG: TIGR00730 family Rossman fold protein [Planctomycetota bacterium]|nr:TIGR00730 family Rossman fold protein [Planctomycetota bacterium]
MNDPKLEARLQEIINHSSYEKAYKDLEFIGRTELRPLRLELELLKPQMMLSEAGIEETIVVFGGTQIIDSLEADEQLAAASQALKDDPENEKLKRAVFVAQKKVEKSHYYDECREFARLVSEKANREPDCNYFVVTGGGPGVMEAANRGAYDADRRSIGLNITLPFEQVPNPYITPGLCFNFHYFALRKMHFLFPAQALVCFPGGFGTLDELFTALTLRQTGRMQKIPIILYGQDYWKNIINFDFLADEGVISDEHLDLIFYTETPAETLELIEKYHRNPPSK